MFSITKQLNYGKLCSKLPNMTFILGARCIDGVVLVGILGLQLMMELIGYMIIKFWQL
jgi:hypothetical protein